MTGTEDEELLAAVRRGDTRAFAELYDRHGAAARRLAHRLAHDPHDADDLLGEALTKVLAAMRTGTGPTDRFRAYLLTAVRHACYDRTRRERRWELTGEPDRLDAAADPGSVTDPALARWEQACVARAFARLPERWRTVLWLTVVDGVTPAEVAGRVGLSPNAVAAAAYRARERLRQLFLQEHLNGSAGSPAADCRWTSERLGAHVRCGLAQRERSRVEAHLAGCCRCRTVCAELADANAGLRAPRQSPRGPRRQPQQSRQPPRQRRGPDSPECPTNVGDPGVPPPQPAAAR